MCIGLMLLLLKLSHPTASSKNLVRSQAPAELSNKFWKPQQHSLAQPNQVASSIHRGFYLALSVTFTACLLSKQQCCIVYITMGENHLKHQILISMHYRVHEIILESFFLINQKITFAKIYSHNSK